MRHSSIKPEGVSCNERSHMKRSILLCLMVILAACQTQPGPGSGPGEEPGETPGGNEPLVCNDGQHAEVFNSKPIEFGQAYEVTNETTYFTTTQSVPAGTTLSIRLDNVPSTGASTLLYTANTASGHVMSENFSDFDAPIPSSTVGQGISDEGGQVTLQITYRDPNYQENGCAKFQFMLNRD